MEVFLPCANVVLPLCGRSSGSPGRSISNACGLGTVTGSSAQPACPVQNLKNGRSCLCAGSSEGKFKQAPSLGEQSRLTNSEVICFAQIPKVPPCSVGDEACVQAECLVTAAIKLPAFPACPVVPNILNRCCYGRTRRRLCIVAEAEI